MSKHPSGLTDAQLWYRYHRYPPLLAKLATFALAVALVYGLFRSVEAVLVPVLISLLVAYLLDPLVDVFEARGWTRSATILGLLGLGALVVGAYLLFLYPTIAHQVANVTDGIPKLIKRAESELLPWAEQTFDLDVPDSWSSALTTYGGTLRSQIPTLTSAASTAATEIWSRVGGLLASAVNLVMIPVFIFFFLRDFDHMRLAVVEYLPTNNRDAILARIQKMDTVVGAWFRGQVEVALILALLYAVGLAVVFGWSGVGVGAGIAVGVLAGILNIIPYFGFAIGFSLSVLMVLLEGSGLAPLLAVLAVFAIVQGLEGYVITPRIVGDKVGLSPVAVIIALLLGGELLGLVGLLLALPVAGIVRVLWPDVVAWYKTTTFYRGDDSAEPVSAVAAGITAALAQPPTDADAPTESREDGSSPA